MTLTAKRQPHQTPHIVPKRVYGLPQASGGSWWIGHAAQNFTACAAKRLGPSHTRPRGPVWENNLEALENRGRRQQATEVSIEPLSVPDADGLADISAAAVESADTETDE